MIRIQKILAAVDFSAHSDIVLRYAGELARACNAEVLVTHVIAKADALSQLPPVGEGYFPPNFEELQRDAAGKAAEKAIAAAGLTNARVAIAAGNPFVEIVQLARTENVDLIIVGTHGRGAVAHMLLGSVAEKVVRKAPCPVLTVREGEHEFIMP
ncbi:MAG: universal stress protein [Planctomycetaceae bacterium]